jgi:hypothetical protein
VPPTPSPGRSSSADPFRRHCAPAAGRRVRWRAGTAPDALEAKASSWPPPRSPRTTAMRCRPRKAASGPPPRRPRSSRTRPAALDHHTTLRGDDGQSLGYLHASASAVIRAKPLDAGDLAIAATAAGAWATQQRQALRGHSRCQSRAERRPARPRRPCLSRVVNADVAHAARCPVRYEPAAPARADAHAVVESLESVGGDWATTRVYDGPALRHKASSCGSTRGLLPSTTRVTS